MIKKVSHHSRDLRKKSWMNVDQTRGRVSQRAIRLDLFHHQRAKTVHEINKNRSEEKGNRSLLM